MADGSANFVSGKDTLIYLICPYDEYHQIWQEHFLTHIVNCRNNYLKDCAKQGIDVDMVVCKYNWEHHLPSSEIDKHMKECPNNYDVLKFKSAYSKTQTYGGAAKYNPALSKENGKEPDYSWEPDYIPPDDPPQTNTHAEEEKLRFTLPEEDSVDDLYDSPETKSTSDEDERPFTLAEPDSGVKVAEPEPDSGVTLAEPDNALNDLPASESSSDEQPLLFTWRTD